MLSKIKYFFSTSYSSPNKIALLTLLFFILVIPISVFVVLQSTGILPRAKPVFTPTSPPYPCPKGLKSVFYYDPCPEKDFFKTMEYECYDGSKGNYSATSCYKRTKLEAAARETCLNLSEPFCYPEAKNKISWKTFNVSLEADDFYILINGRKFYPKSERIKLDSYFNPFSEYQTELNATWFEDKTEMRLVIRFHGDGTNWWVKKISTYNGQTDPNRINYDLNIPKTPFNQPYYHPGILEIQGIDQFNVQGTIHFENLSLKPFLYQNPPPDYLPTGYYMHPDRPTVFYQIDWEGYGTRVVLRNKDGEIIRDLTDFSFIRSIDDPSIATLSTDIEKDYTLIKALKTGRTTIRTKAIKSTTGEEVASCSQNLVVVTDIFAIPTLSPTPSFTTPTLPPDAKSKISIFAAGTPSDNIYPVMKLQINGKTVKSWDNVNGDPRKRKFIEYTYHSPTKLTPGSKIRVFFTNDSGKRNLAVDKIIIDSTTYQSEEAYSTGTWTKEKGCSSGFFETEWLHCNGYFEYQLK